MHTSGPPLRVAGAVLWRPAPAGEAEVALVRRPDRGDWVLPSGPSRAGETELEAAVRVVTELDGGRASLGRHLGTVRFEDTRDGVPRRLLLSAWAMRASGDPAGSGELDGRDAEDGRDAGQVAWLAPAEAAALVARDVDRELLACFQSAPAQVSRLLLLRHAEAGRWHGPDAERPLDETGRARAQRLREVLAALDVRELLASPATRCQDTVAPAAGALGLPVAEEALLAEHCPDLDKAVELLAGLAPRPGTTVVCSHAPTIGLLLERLTSRQPDLLPRPARLDPGGAWCVEFAAAARGEDPAVAGLWYLPPPVVPA